MNKRIPTGGGIIVIAVCCIWAYILIAGEPRLGIGVADGTYSNSCCGSLTLKNGVMTVESRRVRYVIEQDKEGPYVLPAAYVGASEKRFVIRPQGYALKLRLDRAANPRNIELIDDRPDAAAYSFVRSNGS